MLWMPSHICHKNIYYKQDLYTEKDQFVLFYGGVSLLGWLAFIMLNFCHLIIKLS